MGMAMPTCVQIIFEGSRREAAAFVSGYTYNGDVELDDLFHQTEGEKVQILEHADPQDELSVWVDALDLSDAASLVLSPAQLEDRELNDAFSEAMDSSD